MKKLIKFLRLHAKKCCLFVNLTGTEKIHGNLDHSSASTLAISCLEHPELTVLDCELHILHVLVIVFQAVGDCDKFSSTYGHRFFERGIFLHTFFFSDALKGCPTAASLNCNLLRSTDTGYDILALRVDKILAVEYVLACGRITAESHTCCRIVAHVAIYHGLNINGSTPLFRYLVHAAIENSTFVHPAVKHSADATPKLFPCTVGEVFSGKIFYSGFEEFHEILQVFNIQLSVKFDAFFGLDLVHNLLKRINVGLAFGFHAKNHVTVHLHKTTIAVPCETGISALFCKRSYSSVVHSQIEHGIHHAGH